MRARLAWDFAQGPAGDRAHHRADPQESLLQGLGHCVSWRRRARPQHMHACIRFRVPALFLNTALHSHGGTMHPSMHTACTLLYVSTPLCTKTSCSRAGVSSAPPGAAAAARDCGMDRVREIAGWTGFADYLWAETCLHQAGTGTGE